MELIKDYDCTIHYHPGKANVVADALSQKSAGSLSCVQCEQIESFNNLKKMGVLLELSSKDVMLARFIVRPIFIDQIREGQNTDEFLASKKEMVAEILRESSGSAAMGCLCSGHVCAFLIILS